MKHVTLEDYSWNEIAWLGDMIVEKLADMGYEGVGSIHFSVEVEFEEAEHALAVSQPLPPYPSLHVHVQSSVVPPMVPYCVKQ